MPRSTAQNEAMRVATRDAVLDAALRCFARRGFAAASIREIASEAGISTGLIYRHYATKDHLFGDLLDRAIDGLAQTVRTMSDGDDPLEVLRDFTQRFLDDLSDGEGAAEFYVVLDRAVLADDPVGARERLLPHHRAFRRALIETIERGQRLGQLAPDAAEELAGCYLAMLSGIATMRVTLADGFALPTTETVLRVLRGGAG